jgi:hypothetical protein
MNENCIRPSVRRHTIYEEMIIADEIECISWAGIEQATATRCAHSVGSCHSDGMFAQRWERSGQRRILQLDGLKTGASLRRLLNRHCSGFKRRHIGYSVRCKVLMVLAWTVRFGIIYTRSDSMSFE